MSQLNINNATLLNLDNEIQQIQKSALGILLQGRIAEWQKNTAIRVNTLRQSIKDIQDKFLVIENGQVQFTDEMDEQKNKIPKMKEGLLFASFKKDIEDLMAKPVTINI